MDVLVLSTGFEPLYHVAWSKAIIDIFVGRVEIIENSDTRFIGTVRGQVPMPMIVRFKKGVFAHQWIKHTGRCRLNRKNLWIRDSCICQYCAKQVGLKQFEIEHVVPKSRGGRTVWENVVVSCSRCNNKKGAMTPKEANMKLLRKPINPRKLDMLIPLKARLDESK